MATLNFNTQTDEQFREKMMAKFISDKLEILANESRIGNKYFKDISMPKGILIELANEIWEG